LKIIFFDTSLDLYHLRNNVNQDDLIITLDYDSHNLLLDNKINHKISDEFLIRNDLETIQYSSYKVIKWFEDKKFKNFNYDGFNLGSSIQVELNYYLVPFIKKFLEMGKIVEKFPNAEFISSDNYELILRKFCKNYKIIKSKINKKNEFYYDYVTIPINVGDKNVNLKISNKKFLKIKKIVEKIVNSYINKKKNYENQILLVEFDSNKFSPIFEKINKISFNTVLFNRRRPNFTNLKSISTLKKTKSTVFSESNIDKSLFLSKNDKEKFKNNYLKILDENQEFLISNFSINGNSFYDVIKDKFYDLLSRRILFVLDEIELVNALFVKSKIRTVLVWSEIGLTESIVVNVAKKNGIPIILLQHGYFFDDNSKGTYEMNLFQGVFPKRADHFLVWGDKELRHQINSKIPEKTLHSIGTPHYDNKNYSNINEEFVLLATSGPVKENTFDLTIETIEKNREAIKRISQVVTNNNKKLIIKIHPSPDEFDPSELIKTIDPNIQIIKTGDVFKLIKSCIMLVVIDVSTVILDAQIIGKPIISVKVKDSGFGIPSIIDSNSFPSVSIDEFEDKFLRILNDDIFSNNIIDAGKEFSNKYIKNLGEGTDKIIEFVSDICNEKNQ
jgi:hypothetical protein